MKRKLIINKLKTLFKKHREIVLYVAFGGATTGVSFAAYFCARWLLPFESTSAAVTISWVCAVTFAYIANKIWVFKSRQQSYKKLIIEAALFYLARFFTLIVDLVMMFLLIDLTEIQGVRYELFARIAVSVVILVLNYLFSKIIVFRNGSGKR